ncbi:hypothetical protein A3H26_03035 [candidate division WWE3 bacterium RIFCSPLOWO2_12_FULL_36_10]|uniref:Aldehyde ferredoxin oxidoreductase N-terminal domain-containing protein n=1 Tax=candidate division WWE3 bacterium RIFCSPLOWO2_12_FULL_36_10 TaxID=1802630 RepID=A0A1F4VJ19_UNCKA|nr:MAG: hypothetical protein A3H26_03035 [candidate division WWE3 bacterium RIFCSPLOWO2_12_FULL_36_10]
MDYLNKQILYINLEKNESEAKTFSELRNYIGGVGLGLKLLSIYKDEDPIIFSVGPLNGFFPFVSKTSVVFQNEGSVEDIYFGGSLSFRLKFLGIDAVVLSGISKNPTVINIDDAVSFMKMDEDIKLHGLPGKRSIVSLEAKGLFLDGYFQAPERILEQKFVEKNIKSIIFTGSKTFSVVNEEKYHQIYKEILSRVGEMSVQKRDKPSCSGCPVGCSSSGVGEIGGNVLVHCLVGCSFAEKIYSDVGTIFSCFNVLGYDYTHEDIENVPRLIAETLAEFS